MSLQNNGNFNDRSHISEWKFFEPNHSESQQFIWQMFANANWHESRWKNAGHLIDRNIESWLSLKSTIFIKELFLLIFLC